MLWSVCVLVRGVESLSECVCSGESSGAKWGGIESCSVVQ